VQEYFAYRGSKELLDLIDRAGQRAGVGRSRAFSDWLEMCICALSGGRMEDRYLEIINPYGAGERTAKGKLYDDRRRAIDDLADAFGCLVRHTEETRGDILGDAFMGGNLNDAGQFFTPDNVCELMARMTNHDEKIVGKRIADPCCGSGRMLLAAARLNPHNFFFGQDTDLRCVRMTAINLALWACAARSCGATRSR